MRPENDRDALLALVTVEVGEEVGATEGDGLTVGG
jgi:hypothetical protein